MSDNPLIKFRNIKEACLSTFKEKELWPTYFERRYLEFLTFFDLLPKKNYTKILELGCGMGYYSAFLSAISEKVIATDLEVTDPQTHSIGLQATRDFLSALKIENVSVVHASAEELPFEDNSFDLVFSSHVIEHVPDMEKAVKEINRVLKPGGINFCVVPTTADRIYSLPSFYIYLIQRLFSKIFSRPASSKTRENEADVVQVVKTGASHYFKHLPFPPPHGVYPSYLAELKNWTISKWRAILTQNGSIKLIRQHGLQINPLLSLIGGVFPLIGLKAYSFTRKLENKLSENALLKHFGISTLLITEKTSSVR